MRNELKDKNSSRIADHPSRHSGGFTLLELMIVIFLIVIILGLSSFFFINNLPSSRFNATVREMASMVRYARALAQTNGEEQIITIDLDSKKYSIEGRVEKKVPPDINIKILDPFSGEIDNGKTQILFQAIGGVDGKTIVLSNNRKSASIEMDPVVGAVVVK